MGVALRVILVVVWYSNLAFFKGKKVLKFKKTLEYQKLLKYRKVLKYRKMLAYKNAFISWQKKLESRSNLKFSVDYIGSKR